MDGDSDDWKLLERWQDGDRGAGNELARRYFGMLARFFHNKVANHDDAIELVSETLLICSRSKERINKHSVRSYIFAIALNQLRAYYRKQKKRKRELSDFSEVCAAELSPSAPSLIGRKREQQILVQALRKIPLEHQIALELKLFEGLKGAEIAELLGIPRGTVQSRLRLGKKRLLKTIEDASDNSTLYKSTVTNLEDWAKGIRQRVDGV